ncbi:hypothetical protein GCM10009830_23150 [Glycomyces endophyticus]|uniref:VCBS repeat-containing protein n=1 Tax=Glycomyces endophyticus TaxID=480996 RepID=A0ABN2GS10_9ACTN
MQRYSGKHRRQRRLRHVLAAATAAAAAGAVPGVAAAQADTAEEAVEAQAVQSRNDFDGDGNQDLMVVRKSDGNLLFYAGNGDGTFDPSVAVDDGWGGLDIAMAGDATGDGEADLRARDRETGVLYTYPGDGSGGFGAPIEADTGWTALGAFAPVGDEAGEAGVIAVNRVDGKLYHYADNGDGTLAAGVAVGGGWRGYDNLANLGDVDADGNADFLARNSRDGSYYVYFGLGDQRFGNRVAVDHALGNDYDDRYYHQVAGVGDVDGDGFADVAAVDARFSQMWLQGFDADGGTVHGGTLVGRGWGAMNLPAGDLDLTYDYNGDGHTDMITRHGTTGTTSIWLGRGSGTLYNSIALGDDLKDMDLIETAGDANGDGFADLFARTQTGVLYIYPGTGTGDYDAAARDVVGSGWGAMSTIVGGHDHNSDGKPDIFAVEEATGRLWFYPGNGNGGWGTRTSLGTGWAGFSHLTAIGDHDSDGHADVIAVDDQTGCLNFFGGRGDGTLETGVQLNCGWGVMNAVVAVGDFNNDGWTDWIGRHQNGFLKFYGGGGNGTIEMTWQFGNGWNTLDILA